MQVWSRFLAHARFCFVFAQVHAFCSLYFPCFKIFGIKNCVFCEIPFFFPNSVIFFHFPYRGKLGTLGYISINIVINLSFWLVGMSLKVRTGGCSSLVSIFVSNCSQSVSPSGLTQFCPDAVPLVCLPLALPLLCRPTRIQFVMSLSQTRSLA